MGNLTHDLTYNLLTVLQAYAPTGTEQGQVAQTVNEMRAAGEPERNIQLTLAGSITDGLRYGNWPWV